MPTGLATWPGLVIHTSGAAGRAPDVSPAGDGLWLSTDSRLDAGSLPLGAVTVSAGLVLVLAAPLAGPGVTAAQVLAATGGVMAALEAAAEGSVCHVVLGSAVRRPDMDLPLIGVLLEIDGVQVATAAGAAGMGGPAEAAAAGLNVIAPDGLPAGALVYTGGLTAPVALADPSHAQATFAYLGRVGLRLAS